jgi:uncharacterized protein YhjY with autotransporter beta-barrel domain
MPGRSWRRFLLPILLVCGFAHLPALADFASECNTGCHSASGITGGGRVNAADAASVIQVANTVNFMGTNPANWASIAAEIGAANSPLTQSDTINFGATKAFTVQKIVVAGSTVLNTLQQVPATSPATGYSFTAGSNSFSWTHPGTDCSPVTLHVRGIGPFNATAGATPITAERSVNLTVNAPSAPVAANTSPTINYSTGAQGVTLNLSGTAATGINIISPLSPAIGTLNVAGTSVTYTGSATQYASSLTFSYQATGPCGTTSSTATVTINVNPPPAPAITSANSTTATGGQAFSFQVTASNVPASFAATGTLPNGVNFNTATGVLSGTPTQAGTFPLSITATNSSGTSSAQSFTLQVNYATPVVTSGATANGTGDVPGFSYQITATNLPQSYSVTGALPTGVTIDTSTGLVSGTPTQAGTFPVTVNAINPAGTGSKAVTITIASGTPVITSANTANGLSGQAISYQITATYGPHTFNAAGLPAGVTINTGTGLISGAFPSPGSFPVTVSATGPGGTGQLVVTFTIGQGPPQVTSANSAVGATGNPMSYQITATQSPTSYNATGLPPGLGINTATGLISGTPTSGGSFPVTVSATNAGGTGQLVVTFTISVLAPAITSPATATGQSFVAMTYQITAINAPLTYGASGLPPGLTVDVNTGLISGAPTATGVFNATVTSSNGAGTGSQGVVFTITLGPPIITSPASATGAVGIAFSYQVTTQNPATGFNATGLPPGLSINTGTGLISGTPTTTGTFPANVTATNATGTSNQGVSITIAVGIPVISSPNAATGQTGVAFTYQIAASNGPSSFNATGLPPGLTVNTTTGLVSGVPSSVGTFNAIVSATNGTGTGTLGVTFTITLGPPVITSAATAQGATGVAFTYQITATNNPTSFNATGLPAGLSINTSTGVISGAPAATGTTNVTLSATNAIGTGTQTLVFTVVTGPPVLTSPATVSAQTGVPFSFTVTGTNSPTSFTATGLPIGLTLNTATGVISGIPGAVGAFSVALTAANASGTGTQTLVITVSIGPPGITSEPTASGTVGQPFTYQIRATNFPTSFNATGLPPGLAVNTGNGVISGTPTTGGTFTVVLSASNATTTVTQSVTFTIAFVAPVATSLSLDVVYQTPTSITLAATGVVTKFTIVTPPAHGTLSQVAANGLVTYTPAAGYSGPDSFTYRATGPGGDSAEATVTIVVGTLKPVAVALTMTLQVNSSLTVDLAGYVTGSGLTGVAVTTDPRHGTAAVNGLKVTYTPQHDFFGADSFAYVVFGNAGTSAPATITVTVIGRSDPSKDANVIGVVAAQQSAAQRFARAQISNFQQRLESLHSRKPEPVAEAAAPAPRLAAPERRAPAEPPVQVAAAGGSVLIGEIPATTNALSSALANSMMSLAGSQVLGLAANGSPGGLASGTSVWLAGNLRFGYRDPTSGAERLRFTTDGVSGGIDKRFSDRLVLGVGAGFARDQTDIGTDGTNTEARGTAIAAYGTYHPARGVFVDTIVGYGSFDLDTVRFVPLASDFAKATRKGEQWFGSLSAGYEHRHEGFLVSPYARLDYASTRLKQATESGAGQNALVYFEQTLPMFQGSLGLRAESQHDTRFGSVRPRARIEFTRDFEDERGTTIAYADEFGTRYTVAPGGVRRNSLLLGIGSDFNFGGGLKLGLDYQVRRASNSDLDQGIRLQITQELGGTGPSRWFGVPDLFTDPVRVDASYTWDDNLPRAREARDKLADHVFGVNVSKGRIFRTSDHTRIVASVFGQAEELYEFTGLGRFSGGAQAELQYRGSGDFDAITFGLLGRVQGDYYQTDNRRGYRYSVALSARRSLTDRIEAFAALTGNARFAKSAVWDNKDYGAKLNLDYALGGPNGSLYLTGEYRRGDFVSSGRFALDSIDIAEVFTPDDAFGPGYFAYRFDAKAWLGTLGYNRPLGPRDALDLSWRRVQVTPLDRPTYDLKGPFRYIDNQYSIVYLMRF